MTASAERDRLITGVMGQIHGMGRRLPLVHFSKARQPVCWETCRTGYGQ